VVAGYLAGADETAVTLSALRVRSAIRDFLLIEESAHLSAQLLLLVRGIY
jgi:uncharacterized protein (DUF2267 family)